MRTSGESSAGYFRPYYCSISSGVLRRCFSWGSSKVQSCYAPPPSHTSLSANARSYMRHMFEEVVLPRQSERRILSEPSTAHRRQCAENRVVSALVKPFLRVEPLFISRRCSRLHLITSSEMALIRILQRFLVAEAVLLLALKNSRWSRALIKVTALTCGTLPASYSRAKARKEVL